MKMDKLHIREACISDLMSLNQLYAQIDQAHHEAHPEHFKPANEIERPETYFEKLLNDQDTKLLVAILDKEVIGFVHAEVREMDHPALYRYRYGHISDVVVDSRFKRKGVGNLLFQSVEQWLKDKDVREISLTVFNFNKEAISFYQDSGFTNRHCKMVKSLT